MKSILTLLISVLSFGAFAQAPSTGGNCWREWYTLFKERGATAVPDGSQEVIITLRSNDYAQCFMGRIDVAGGKLSGRLQVQKVDGTYEEFDKKVSAAYQNPEGTLREELRDISNGMSASVTLSDGEIIRLFFIKSLAEKPKANKKAPSAASLK